MVLNFDHVNDIFSGKNDAGEQCEQSGVPNPNFNPNSNRNFNPNPNRSFNPNNQVVLNIGYISDIHLNKKWRC